MSEEILILEGEEINSETAILDTINTTLVKANVTDAVIAKLKADYLPLKINGQEDKEGYLTVQEARKDAKKLRILAEKLCKKGREDAVKEQKLWLRKESEVVDQISEVEDYLEKQEKSFEAERDRLKAEKKAKEEQQFATRLQELIKLGGTFDGTCFVINEHSFEAVLVREATQDIYEQNILPPFKDAYMVTETARRLDEERKAKELAEIERIKQEQEANTERLRLQQEELDRQQRAIDEAKEQEQRRLYELAKAEQEAEIKRRCNQLMELGLRFSFDDNAYTGYDCYFHYLDITGYDNGKWTAVIEKATLHIEERKADEARTEAARIENEKQTAIQRALDEQNERQRLEAERKENERLAEEQRRVDELNQASDREKWAHFLIGEKEKKYPEMKSGPYRKKVAMAKEKTDEIISL